MTDDDATAGWACATCGEAQPPTARWCGRCGEARPGRVASSSRPAAVPTPAAAGSPPATAPPVEVGADGLAAPLDDAGADDGVVLPVDELPAHDAGPSEEVLARRRRVAAALAAAVVLVGAVVVALRPAPDVPRNGSPLGDAGRSGEVAASAVGPLGDVVWSTAAPVEEDALRNGDLVVAGDLVLVNGEDGVTAVELANGTVRWTRRGEGGAAVARGSVVLGGPRGTVLVDPTSGAEQYRPVNPFGETAAAPRTGASGDGSLVVMRSTGLVADGETSRPARVREQRGVLVGRDDEGRQVWRLDVPDELDRELVSVIGNRDDVLVVVLGPLDPTSQVDHDLELAAVEVDRGFVRWRAPIGSALMARDRVVAMTALVGDVVVHPAPESIVALDRLRDPETGAPLDGRYDQPALPSQLLVRDLDDGAARGTVPGFAGTSGTQAGDDLDGPTGLRLVAGDDGLAVLQAANTVLVHDATTGELRWRVSAPPSLVAVGVQTVTLVRLNTLTVHERETGRVVREETFPPFTVLRPAPRGGDVVVLHPDRRVERVAPDGVPRWTVQLAPDQTSPVVATTDTVVTRSERDTLVVDAADGTRRWLVEDRGGGAVAAALPVPELAFDGRFVLLPSTPTLTTSLGDPRRGAPRPRPLRALDAVTGTTAWQRDDDRFRPSGPLALEGDDGFVAVGDQVHAYDLGTGRRSFAANSGALLHAVAVTPRLVVGAERLDLDARTREDGVLDDDGDEVVATGAVVAVDRARREPAWRRQVDPCLDVLVRGDQVLTATADGVLALDLRTGVGRWGARPPHQPCGALVAGATHAVSTDLGRMLSGLELATGEVAWTVQLDAPLATTPVVTGDEVLLADASGRFVGLELATGEYRWERELGLAPTTAPVVVDGDVVVRTAEVVARIAGAG